MSDENMMNCENSKGFENIFKLLKEQNRLIEEQNQIMLQLIETLKWLK